MKNPARFVRPFALLTGVLVVLACGGGGNTLGAPSIPTGVTGVPGNGEATLAWNPSNGATHYNVKRSLAIGGPFAVIAGPNVPAFTDTGLTNGTTYYYVISADSVVGESGNSAVVAVTPTP
ncbi:MAG: fibronectin type III domain-containing protein [Fimbriimonadaceae bacterium]